MSTTSATVSVRAESRCSSQAAVEAEFADDDELVRALPLRLAAMAAEGHGVAAVTALRALGELVAAQRSTP